MSLHILVAGNVTVIKEGELIWVDQCTAIWYHKIVILGWVKSKKHPHPKTKLWSNVSSNLQLFTKTTGSHKLQKTWTDLMVNVLICLVSFIQPLFQLHRLKQNATNTQGYSVFVRQNHSPVYARLQMASTTNSTTWVYCIVDNDICLDIYLVNPGSRMRVNLQWVRKKCL